MISFVKGTLLLVIVLCLSGCFPGRSTVILLPDEDGNVGEIRVKSGNKTVVVDEAYRSVTTFVPFLQPGPPKHVTKQEVESTFKAAMAKEPQQRFRFEKRIIYFLHNSIEMTKPSKAMLPKTLQYLKNNPPYGIYIVGHADRAGTEYYNSWLSLQRAVTMRQAFIDGGVTGKIIVISYHGESIPAVATPDEVVEPKNRRAELVFQYLRSQTNDSR